jgi:phenazine biosynthesis protein
MDWSKRHMTETAERTADETTTRSANRAIIEQYLNTSGEDRLVLHQLFTEDGTGGVWTTGSGEPIIIRGRAHLAEHDAWALRCLPEWTWANAQIFETQDPDWFWVEVDGEGTMVFPGYPAGHYTNHFLISFQFRDGKIHRMREFMNPCQQFRALGIAVPQINRAGLRT